MAELIYTLDTINPYNSRIEDDIEQLNSFVSLRSRLSVAGVHKFSNVLLSLLKFVFVFEGSRGSETSKISCFASAEFIDGNACNIVDNDRLYLVERVTSDNADLYLRPLRVLSIDVRVMKTVIVQKMCQIGMDWDEIKIVSAHYNLEEYLSLVRVGGAGTVAKIEFVNMYYKYMYEFYKRSKKCDVKVLAEYKQKSEVHNSACAYSVRCDVYGVNLYMSLWQSKEQTMANIQEYCDNMKFYANRLYEINYSQDHFEATCGIGNATSSVKFSLLERCLVVYDLFNGIVTEVKSIEDISLNSQIDRIVRRDLVKKCPDLAKKSHLDLRKEVRKCYKNALRLIEESIQGYLTI